MVQHHAHVYWKSGFGPLVITHTETECKSDSDRRDVFFNLSVFIHEKVCSQL